MGEAMFSTEFTGCLIGGGGEFNSSPLILDGLIEVSLGEIPSDHLMIKGIELVGLDINCCY